MLLGSWQSACSVRCSLGALQTRELPPCHWDTGTLYSAGNQDSCSGYPCGNVGSNSGIENVNSTRGEFARLFPYKVVLGFVPFTSPFFLAFKRSTLICLTGGDVKQLSVLKKFVSETILLSFPVLFLSMSFLPKFTSLFEEVLGCSPAGVWYH